MPHRRSCNPRPSASQTTGGITKHTSNVRAKARVGPGKPRTDQSCSVAASRRLTCIRNTKCPIEPPTVATPTKVQTANIAKVAQTLPRTKAPAISIAAAQSRHKAPVLRLKFASEPRPVSGRFKEVTPIAYVRGVVSVVQVPLLSQLQDRL